MKHPLLMKRFKQNSDHLENIHACMISSPDIPDDEIYKLCKEKDWLDAKKGYEDAASDLELQVILSPLEILPPVPTLKVLLK